MKKPRASLSLRVNLLLVLIILVTSGLLLAGCDPAEALERALNARAEEKPEEIVRAMRETLDCFTRGADVTMMCLKYYGAEGKTGC